MKEYCKNHELLVMEAIKKKEVNLGLIAYHHERIRWLQHERLVHFLTLMLTALLFVIFFIVSLWKGALLYFCITGILMILTFFYCLHYYYLENTVQGWYEISDALEKERNKSCKI